MDKEKRRPGGGGAVSFASYDGSENTASTESVKSKVIEPGYARYLITGCRALIVEERERVERRFQSLALGSIDIDLADLVTHRRALASLAAAEADLAGRAAALDAAERDIPLA